MKEVCWMDVATILVTDALESVFAKVATLCSFKLISLFVAFATMPGARHRDFARLPQIHLSAANLHLPFLAFSCYTCLSLHSHVFWHRSSRVGTNIIVASAKLGANQLVVLGVLALTTIFVYTK